METSNGQHVALESWVWICRVGALNLEEDLLRVNERDGVHPGLGHLLTYVSVMDYPSSSISETCCVLDTLDQQGFPPHSGEVQWGIIRPHVWGKSLCWGE